MTFYPSATLSPSCYDPLDAPLGAPMGAPLVALLGPPSLGAPPCGQLLPWIAAFNRPLHPSSHPSCAVRTLPHQRFMAAPIEGLPVTALSVNFDVPFIHNTNVHYGAAFPLKTKVLPWLSCMQRHSVADYRNAACCPNLTVTFCPS